MLLIFYNQLLQSVIINSTKKPHWEMGWLNRKYPLDYFEILDQDSDTFVSNPHVLEFEETKRFYGKMN